MAYSSVCSKGIRKEILGIKTVLIRIVLPLLLIPFVLMITTFFLSSEIEGALSERSRILYSGPDDLRTFISQDPLFDFLQEDFEPQIHLRSSADIVLEIDGERAYIHFAPERISSIIAYERLSKLLSRYGEISAQGEDVAVYYETADQGLLEAGESDRHSLYHAKKLLLASIISLLVFSILVSGGIRIFSGKATAFTKLKEVILSQLILSALVVFSTFMSANYLIPLFLPDVMEDFILFTDINILYVLFISVFMIGISAAALNIYAHIVSGNGVKGAVFIVSAIFLNLSAIGGKMPEWSYYVPILNLQVIIRDAIIYGLESGRLVLSIGINIGFCAMCMILSFKAANGRRINFNEKGLL